MNEKNPKVKKHNSFIFHDYLIQYCSGNRNWLSHKDGSAHFANQKCK